jgi:CBS domain-containing protein
MKISEIMTTKPHVIKASDNVLKAAEMFAHYNIGALPVEKDERLIGMLTDRDVVKRVVAGGRNPANTRVEEVLSPQVKYCFEDEDTAHVAQNMHELQVRRLPVMDRNKRLVGIVSLEDISSRTR